MTTTRLLGDLTGVSYDDLVEAFGEPRRCDRSEKDYVEWRIETPEDGVVSIYDQGRDGDFHGGGRLTLTDVHVRLRRWRMNGGRVASTAPWHG